MGKSHQKMDDLEVHPIYGNPHMSSMYQPQGLPRSSGAALGARAPGHGQRLGTPAAVALRNGAGGKAMGKPREN